MKNNNWYRTSLEDELLKEAGAKESMAVLLIGTLSAVATFFEGNMLMNYLNENKVPIEQQQALVQTVNSVNQTNKAIQELDKDDFVKANENIETNFSEKEYDSREAMPAEEVVARTLYDEARGEGYEGMEKVALVILNRSNGSAESMKSICLKPWQFSGWNNNNMLPRGEGSTWDQAKELSQHILNPETEPDKNGNHYFVNPEVVLKQKGINVKIENIEDVKNLSEQNLKKLPAFMFNGQKKDLGQGRWKWTYPKVKDNVKPAKVEGNHFFYTR